MKNIFNYLEISPILSCSGMPSREQLPNLADDGVKVVINLATPKSEGWMPDEKEILEARNIIYYGLPIEWEEPTLSDLNTFMDIMERHRNRRIHVHCQANYRATAFIMLYRVIHLGWAEGNALRDVLKIWNPAEYPVWQQFIEKSFLTQS